MYFYNGVIATLSIVIYGGFSWMGEIDFLEERSLVENSDFHTGGNYSFTWQFRKYVLPSAFGRCNGFWQEIRNRGYVVGVVEEVLVFSGRIFGLF